VVACWTLSSGLAQLTSMPPLFAPPPKNSAEGAI
jgi:hypothetical protein